VRVRSSARCSYRGTPFHQAGISGHGHTIERSKLTVPRIERPRPAHHRAGRTSASEDYGPVRNAHPHRAVIFRRPNSPALMVHKQRLAHVSWAQRPQDRQAARDTQRSPSLTQPPPRCSRSAPPTLLIAPAEPDPEGLRGAGRLQSRSETAARTCLRAACGLPAGPGLPAAGASAALQRAACLLGACCSDRTRVRTLFSPAALGGVRGCWRCRVWHWAGAETCFVVRFECRPVLSF